uniref:Uncharacterized protein n=1 Tax=Photinus pyralis TaxID=7054 RepID=A0A1Y1MH36_PHOPY
MTNDSLSQYKARVAALTKRAKELNLTDLEIQTVFDECFNELSKSSPTKSRPSLITLAAKITIGSLFIALVTYILLNVHQPTSSIVLRNVQGLIYPGLKVVRFLAVPILKKFPSLTNLYDESCLVENPYFYVSDMECWPCEDVHSVIDLTGFSNYSLYQSGIPYIVQTNQPYVNFKQLKHMYRLHKEMLLRDAGIIKSNNSTVQSLDGLFESDLHEHSITHVSWRINRMSPSQIIRKLFPRPYIVSDRFGQSVERFIMIDAPAAEGYSFPNTECSYVFVIQGSGERTIILKPSKECGSVCRTVSVVLRPSFVLWYNWWYWRPISLPKENVTETSISYISSYC